MPLVHPLRVLFGHRALDPVARLDALGRGVLGRGVLGRGVLGGGLRRATPPARGLQRLELDRRAHLLLRGKLVRAQRAHRGQEAAQGVLRVDARLVGVGVGVRVRVRV